MLTLAQGNLLDCNAEALVNAVNTVGVMGKGIALMFKKAFPNNFQQYQAACKRGEIEIGKIFATEPLLHSTRPKWIINFPTKQNWRNPSQLEWIQEGLDDLRCFINKHAINSIALPPLGCGNGGLNWQDVYPLIVRALGSLQDSEVIIYEPLKEQGL